MAESAPAALATTDAVVGHTTDAVLDTTAPAVPTEAGAAQTGSLPEEIDHSAHVGRPAELFEEAGNEESERPDWLPSKFNTEQDLAKSYTELEKKFGSFKGAPEEYEMNLEEGLEDFAFDSEDAFLKDFTGMMKEGNASQEFYDKVSNSYLKFQQMEAESIQTEIMQTYERDLDELGKEGLAGIKEATAWARDVLPPHIYEQVAEVGNYDVGMANLVKSFYDLYQQKGYSKLPDQAADIENTLDKKVRAKEMMGDPRYGQVGNDAFTKQVDDLYKSLYS